MAPSAAFAADTPESAVHRLLDAIEAENIEDLDGLVCGELQPAVQTRFGVAVGPLPDFDLEDIQDAVDWVITERSVTLIESSEDGAEVRVGGRIGAHVDAEMVRELAELSLGSLGVEVTSEQVGELVARLDAQLTAGSPIADDVTVTLDGSRWIVCDDIAVGAQTGIEGDAAGGICRHMSPAELNTIDEERGGAGFSPYARASWDEETSLCSYDKGEAGIGSANLGYFETPFSQVLEALPGGMEASVDGRRALLAGNDLFVESDGGFLYVNAPAKAAPDGEVDYLTMPAGIAELVMPRLDD